MMKNGLYRIGEKLFATQKFHLDDIYQNVHYYDIGDEFIITEIYYREYEIEFMLNNNDADICWNIDYHELYEFQDLLAHKKDFLKKIRNLKLEQIDELQTRR